LPLFRLRLLFCISFSFYEFHFYFSFIDCIADRFSSWLVVYWKCLNFYCISSHLLVRGHPLTSEVPSKYCCQEWDQGMLNEYICNDILHRILTTKIIIQAVKIFLSLATISVVSTKCIDPRVLEFVVSNTTGNNLWENCISLVF
jgi:hypothetical protein